MFAVQRLRRAEIHGDAVLDHAVPLQNFVEGLERPPAVYHEVFRNDLEPANHGLLFKDVLVMRNAQADAHSVSRVSVEFVRRHALVKRSKISSSCSTEEGPKSL